MKSNKKCYLCGHSYSYCSSCSHKDPIFMATFCSENCQSIFKTLCNFSLDFISKEEARELLDGYDMSNKDAFIPSAQRTLERIYATPVPTAEEPKEEILLFNEEASIEEETIAESPIAPSPVVYTKRKKRKHEVVTKSE